MARIAIFLSLTLLPLTGCVTLGDDPRQIERFTTYQTSDRTTIAVVCMKAQDGRGNEHFHCDKKQIIQFRFQF